MEHCRWGFGVALLLDEVNDLLRVAGVLEHLNGHLTSWELRGRRANDALDSLAGHV
jgi:hypothetical protein